MQEQKLDNDGVYILTLKKINADPSTFQGNKDQQSVKTNARTKKH